MDQNLPEAQPSLNLPEPNPEQPSMPAGPEQQGGSMVNEAQAATAAELSPPPPVPMPAGDPAVAAVPVDDPSVAASQQLSGATNSQTGATTDLPQIADDADLIEKEWVSKAKKIVAETSHDPHLQSEKLTEVRADYVKKRFNIDIKLARE